MSSEKSEIQTLYTSRWLKLQKLGTWEFVSRTNPGGAAVIIAVTPEAKVLFVEQFRVPIKSKTIEFPAGLIGDELAFQTESAELSAIRELEEETGWRASKVAHVHSGPSSAGMSTEFMHFYRASGLQRMHAGGGVAGEDIVVHEIPIIEAAAFVSARIANGYAVDPKVYAGIHFLRFDAKGVALPEFWWA